MSGAPAEQSKKPSESRFKQQTLPAWQPILTPKTVIPTFAIVGIILLAIGIPLLLASRGVVEASTDYTNQCIPPTNSSTGVMGVKNCTLEASNAVVVRVTKKMKAPVYMYYELTNYYQNHRRYVKSRSDAQLRGKPPTSYSDLEDCTPLITHGARTPSQYYLPCGLIAWSRFNDTLALRDARTQSLIPMDTNGVAWESDLKKKFRNPSPAAPGVRLTYYNDQDPTVPSNWVSFDDVDFVVWMRTAGLPHFRKLYRIIRQDLEPGNYLVDVYSRFPVKGFGGTKSVVLSTTSWMGGKNDFLGIAYIVVGALCCTLAVVFFILDMVNPRRLGDQQFLVWQ
eukprot:c26434_g1_i1.p1 GENE.c26434_g1_i1~~c26434_g1_i1.p1  ORF type:complete len:338 (+),score=65.89 c26434_g1_i1:66-1079(+)